MFFVLLNDPLPSAYWWTVSVGGKEVKWHQPAQHKLWSLILVHTQLKPMINAHSSGRMVSSGISDVVIAS